MTVPGDLLVPDADDSPNTYPLHPVRRGGHTEGPDPTMSLNNVVLHFRLFEKNAGASPMILCFILT